MKKYKCKICGAEASHKTYQVREMFFGSCEEFTYFECEQCQCLQITEIPKDLSRHYGEGYYSFYEPVIPEKVEGVRDERRILDVGCGAGKWLLKQYAKGCVNLYGCDPFIEKDISYESAIHIRKCTIHEMEGTFDLIRMGDSFEHVTDPYDTLVSIKRLLDDDGLCLINTPIFPNAAYEICGVHWYGWDAPRHLFIQSLKSMSYLCEKAGLSMVDVTFNSKEAQFISSLLFQRGVPFLDHTEEVIANNFTAEEVQKFKEYTNVLNAKGYGDHAVFALKKN